MKKLFIFSLFTICVTFGVSAYTLELTCTEVQTIDPSGLPADEWKEYIQDLEKIYCGNTGGSTTPSTPDTTPQEPQEP